MILAIYKSRGPTSHDIVDEIRNITGQRRVGHAGTLDPLARGVLVIGVGGWATRRLAGITTGDKEYLATIRLGAESTTDDREGEKTKHALVCRPLRAEVEAVTKNFIGNIMQLPPIFSAVKVSGRAAYKRVRAGEAVRLQPRPVVIHGVEILSYHWPYIKLRVLTAAGVYIRSLARDIGRKLGTGGYLYTLERTRVGMFTKDASMTLGQMRKFFIRGRVHSD